ncbi:hypothetical protein GOV03_02765 [Candidatus Woesearchaeota archaeon]|nr:hypothetical protein [Candidatus Woesearchaeota archaeon]
MELKKEVAIQQTILQLISSLPKEKQTQVLQTALKRTETVPVSIFQTDLPGLESLVVYLKDIKKQTVKDIAQQLNRELSTIYTTYRKAKQKVKKSKIDYSLTIPLIIFSNRKYSILESLVFYLQHDKNLSLVKIARLLNRKYNTIKTVYRRYNEKKKQ